ncbi:MAG: TetR/AcrR family transcriptional regulator C-terminal domain-containing protein [Actinobacteria bacterium]|nr:TetR/AcrR family transcriptional regulator C-terminal domain-containing protein [Actinomycetota bacterium]
MRDRWPHRFTRSADDESGERRPPLDRDRVVEAALELLDEVGLDGLSMRRLADRLGVKAASVYWHVRDKEQLLDLVFDRVIGEVQVPEPDPPRWRQQVWEVAHRMRRVANIHRDVARIQLGRFPIGPNALALSEGLLAIFRAGGVPDRASAHFAALLPLYVSAFSLEENSGLRSPGGDEASPEEVLEEIRVYFASLPTERFPNLSALADDITGGGPDERFEFGLGLLLDGLEKRLDSNGSASR